ncbi:hypothetical protein [Streptomyces lancefieldiae]|uniref:Uncharacterized protein n=1 Tax=Streptomyces lancefieldiae TaxID=3075520 RepID=A0ABU3B0N1_9ACTN|nr:hypothetical protein [Streptomyces sp. DSM 40712]MDT0616000.1 hypothetical protein [Streptomyces sp. DSM 40712]
MTRASWYPAQAGDRLAITMEATETLPQWTEVYEVTEDGQALRFVGSDAPEDLKGGWYAGPFPSCTTRTRSRRRGWRPGLQPRWSGTGASLEP